MGKQKIDRLLRQLKDSHTEDIKTTAAIFAVAQTAVNDLKERDASSPQVERKQPALPPLHLTKADLIHKYGSYNQCRKAAKQAGITFSRSPRWEQLVTAFNYIQACQLCVDQYMARHPSPNLRGIKITIDLDQGLS